MRCTILHASAGRLRVRLSRRHLTLEEADILEIYLGGIEGVLKAKVSEHTGDAVVTFRRDEKCRARVIEALSAFDFDRVDIAPPDHSPREMQHAYIDRIAHQCLGRAVTRFFLPADLRMVMTAVRSISFLMKGVESLLAGKLEVSVLDAASIGVSMARGDFDTAGSVMFLLGVGDTMEEWTHKKSVADLAQAMSLKTDRVWQVTEDGSEILTDIRAIRTGDIFVVRTGNLIPLDGIVERGEGMVNQASITGEPLAAAKREGAYIYAGTAVEEGELFIRVKEESGSGRYDRIIQMIEESEKLKSEAEVRASSLADRLVPWTFGATALTYLLTGNVTRAVSILMVDFCCALKLSMPIAVLSAMREAGDHHIQAKGGKFMEAYAQAETMVFDKTGTLTRAVPSVRDVIPFGGNDRQEMLRLAACLEEHYPHSIANAVVQEAVKEGLDHEERHTRVEYVVAHGIASGIDGKKVRIGSRHFIFEDEGCTVPEGEEEKFAGLPQSCSPLYLAIDGKLAAVILIEDPLKEEAKQAVAMLHKLGIPRLVMITGDAENTARAVAEEVGVDQYRAEVLPEDKAAFVREEHEAGRKVIMIGDGINDSPALSEADVGVAIASGAAIARQIADVTVTEDDLFALVTMRRLSEALMKRIDWNYRTILTFNSFLIAMGAFGLFAPTLTALLHNTSTILIGLKSMTNLLPAAGEEKREEKDEVA